MQQLPGQMSIFDLDMPCGKMFSEHSAATKEKILGSSSKNSAKLQTKQPMFLNLKMGNGTLVGASWGMGIPSRGECLMRDFGEFPREEEGSGLSQILEENVPLKYYLTAKACEGVLRRAKKRGKILDEILETALIQQIERWEKYGSPLPWDTKNLCNIKCYDARGNGDGKISPTITGDHNSRITDYTTLVCEQKVYAIDSLSSNSMKSKNPKSGFHEEKFFKCLDTSNGDPTKNQGGNIILEKFITNSSGDNIVDTLDASYYKGVGERSGKERELIICQYQEVIGALCADDYKGINNQYVSDNKLIVHKKVYAIGNGQRDQTKLHDIAGALNCMHDQQAVCYCIQGNCIDRADTAGCNGKGVKKGESYTLNTIDRHAVCYEESTFYVVRRLTPLECCRLQGMPDKILTIKYSAKINNEGGVWKVNIFANGAEKNFSAKNSEDVAQLNVHINCADCTVQVFKAKKLRLFAQRVEKLFCEHQAGKIDSIVPLNVGINQIVEAIRSNGKGEKQQHMIAFAIQRNGNKFYPLCVNEMEDDAKYVEGLKDCKDTTLKPIKSIRKTYLTLTTLFCSVMNVIISSIVNEIQNINTLYVNFSVYNSWTSDVPHSDAQEYKMWGNGMALPNALYIMEGF